MTLSPTQFLIFALLIGILALLTVTWLKPATVSNNTEIAANVSEWFAVEASSTTIEENGQPKHQVNAERLTHYDQLKQTAIIQPRAWVFHPDNPPWELRANKGLAYHESALEEMREMDLWGNVIIWREASKDEPRHEIQTEFLKFFPEKDFVETDQLVTFIHGKHQMSGVGMWADLNTEKVQLLGKVEGKFINE